MKIIVTGGAGFIGSRVVWRAASLGHEVVVVDRLVHGQAPELPPGVPVIEVDVRHPERVAPAVGSADVVLHLAADASVPHGEAEPLLMAEDNVAGTAGALDLAERVGAREFRFASSAAVYGDPGADLPISESAPVNPLSFYGWSKYAGEQWCRRFAATRGLRLVILRPGNVYGPGQTASGEGGVVARFCERLRAGAPLVREGSGEQVRDFIYVEDVAAAFLHRLGGPADEALVFNVGTGRAVSINDLGEALASIAGQALHWADALPRAGDIFASVFDPSEAAAWGFHPRVPLAAGLEATWRHAASTPAPPV